MFNDVEFGIIPEDELWYDTAQKLYLDFDGVIVDTIKAVCDVYNERWNTFPDYKYANHKMAWRWDMTDIIPSLNGEQITRIFESDKFFQKLDFMEGAENALRLLSGEYDITIVSVGSMLNISKKAEWIKQHLPFIKKVILIFNDGNDADKSMVDMSSGIFIDDHQENLWSANSMEQYVFGDIYDYNKSYHGFRLANWDAVVKRLHHDK